MICECCGARYRRAMDFTLNLDFNEVTRGGTTVTVRPIGAEILSVLMDNYPLPVNRSKIEYRVWPQGEPHLNLVSVHMMHLRKSLSPLGIQIPSQTGPGSKGYWLAIDRIRPADVGADSTRPDPLPTAGASAPAFSGV